MGKEVAAALAGVLREELRRQGLSVKRLAQRADIPQRTVGRILSGRVDAKVSQMFDLALALGLRPGELSRRVWAKMGREHVH